MSEREERIYMVLLESAEEGGYIATFPAIPDLVTQGETLKEARDMATDALRCYFEALRKDGEAIRARRPAIGSRR